MNFVILDVLRMRRYAAIAVASAAIFFAVYVYTQVLFIVENLDVWFASVPRYNLALSLMFATLFGITLSYQVYLRRQPRVCSIGKSMGTTGGATFLGMLVAQCPACASLAALFLPASAFAFFSSNSTIINFVSIGLMLFTLNYLGAFKRTGNSKTPKAFVKKKFPIKYVYGGAAVALTAFILFFAFTPAEKTETSEASTETTLTKGLAPDFSLETLDGKTVSLSDLRGSPVIINFWASWCPFCVREMPLLERVVKEGDIELIFINLQENRETVKNFADRLGIKSAVLLDPDADAKRKYNVFTQPITFFIDKNGAINEKKIGPLTEQELLAKLGRLGKEETAAAETKTVGGEKYLSSVGPSEIISGGPQKDGIPSIDNPKFENVQEADKWLNDDDLVLGISFNGVVKAYPHRLLNWHEIVNDFAGEVPIAVTYCPLCRTGIVYERVIEGETVEFGTSGKLYKSDLVMYDRKTETYWSQVLGQAIKGKLAGMKLKVIPVDTARWADWKRAHPDTLVLSRDTGFPTYLASGRYEAVDLYGTSQPGFAGIGSGFSDTRLSSNSIVYGIAINGEAKAYEEQAIKAAGIINDEVGGQKVLVIWDASLDTGRIYFSPGNFSAMNGRIIDDSGKTWTKQELDKVLARVDSFPHFWFAWAAFYPDTELYK